MVKMATRHTGKIKRFFHDRGYGFIKPDAPGENVFIHINVLKQAGISNIVDGDRVEYMIVDARNGKTQAGDVVLLCRADGAAAAELFKPTRYGNPLTAGLNLICPRRDDAGLSEG